MPNIIIKNEAGEDVTYNNVNTVRFQTDEGAVASYHYLSGEKEVPDVYDYEVIFYDDFGNEIQHNYVDEGDSVEEPTYEREGFIFHGWAHVGDLSAVDRDILAMPITEEYVDPEPIEVDESELELDYDYYTVDILVEKSYKILVYTASSATYTVDFGDGTSESYTYNGWKELYHSYSIGTYTITVRLTDGSDILWGSGLSTSADFTAQGTTYFNRLNSCFQKVVLHENYYITSYLSYVLAYCYVKKLIVGKNKNTAMFSGCNNRTLQCTYVDELYIADGPTTTLGNTCYNAVIHKVRLPKTLKTLSSFGLYGCIDELYIPDSVTTISNCTLSVCYKLRLSPNLATFSSVDNSISYYQLLRNLYIPSSISANIASVMTSRIKPIDSLTILGECTSSNAYPLYPSGRYKWILMGVSGTQIYSDTSSRKCLMAHINITSDGTFNGVILRGIKYLSIDGFNPNISNDSTVSLVEEIAIGKRCTGAPAFCSGRIRRLLVPKTDNAFVLQPLFLSSSTVGTLICKQELAAGDASYYHISASKFYCDSMTIDLTNYNYGFSDFGYVKNLTYKCPSDITINGLICAYRFTIEAAETLSFDGLSQEICILDLPSTLQSISGSAVHYGSVNYGRTNIEEVYVRATTPPTLDSLSSIPYSLKIHVPVDSLSAYKEATNWAVYANLMVGDL